MLACSLCLQDGADAAVFGLTKANSSAEEWLKRAENLFDNSLYDLASKSYTTAGDPVRALMSKAMAMMQHAHSTMGVETSAAKVTKETLYTAACHFVTAASNVRPPGSRIAPPPPPQLPFLPLSASPNHSDQHGMEMCPSPAAPVPARGATLSLVYVACRLPGMSSYRWLSRPPRPHSQWTAARGRSGSSWPRSRSPALGRAAWPARS